MGGEYYERPMEEASSSQSYSASSEKALSQVGLHKSNDPKRWAEEKLVSTHRHPIVFALDVSGSMGDWPKVLIKYIHNWGKQEKISISKGGDEKTEIFRN